MSIWWHPLTRLPRQERAWEPATFTQQSRMQGWHLQADFPFCRVKVWQCSALGYTCGSLWDMNHSSKHIWVEWRIGWKVWLLFIHIYCSCLILGLYNKIKICSPPIRTQSSHNNSVIFGICDIPLYRWSDVWCVFKNSKASLEAETQQINNSYEFYDLFLNTTLYVHFDYLQRMWRTSFTVFQTTFTTRWEPPV